MVKKFVGGAAVALILVGACSPAVAKTEVKPSTTVVAPAVVPSQTISNSGAPGAYRSDDVVQSQSSHRPYVARNQPH